MEIQGQETKEFEARKATVYYSCAFGINKKEVKLHECGRKKYAQYPSAPYVIYTEKRKRKKSGFVKGYKPYLLILDGWDQPSPSDPFIPTQSSTPGITSSKSRYCCFDERYKSDFDSAINIKIENNEVNVIADYREKEYSYFGYQK